MDANSKKQGRRWKEKNHYERHYCELCNAWMASDKQSILRHENGGRHKHNVRQAEITKRKATEEQEKEQALLNKSLQSMEAAAIATIQKDYGLFAGTSLVIPVPTQSAPPTSVAPRPPPPVPSSTTQTSEMSKSEWNERKRAREEERRKKGADEEEDSKRAKVQIQLDEGWYTSTDVTWLEGIVFGDIIEPEMPIQLWRGHSSATLNEKRIGTAWVDAVVAAVRARPSAVNHAGRLVLDVSYLKGSSEDEEELLKSVSLEDVRVQLGHPLDSRVPKTVEQARLLAMGGEDVEVQEEKQEVDAATGFSTWSTVRITRTTTLLEDKQKRDESRAQEASRKQAAAEAETRRLQEVAHAPDSALAAYDVWGKGGGYKGVDIERDSEVDACASVKKLSDGPVAFKKKAGKKRNKKTNRRTTSADDD